MYRQKILSFVCVVLYLALLVFFVGTYLLGFQNFPASRGSLFIALVLICLLSLWPTNFASDRYRPWKDYPELIFLALLALVPRFLWLASVKTIQVSDFKTYYRIASMMADGTLKFQTYLRLFPHVLTFPFILSMPFRVFGSTVLTAQVFNLLLFVGIVLTIFLLANQFLDRRYAILAAALVALWPSQIFFTTMVSTEALFTLLLVLSIGMFYSIRNFHLSVTGITLYGLLGILIAITNAIRPFGLLIVIAVLIYYFVFVIPEYPGVMSWLVKAALFGCLLLGYLGTAKFIHYLSVRTLQGPVANSFLGYSMLVGSNVKSGGEYNDDDASLLDTEYQSGKVHPDKVNQILFSYAIKRIQSSPGDFIKLQLAKNKTMWQEDGFGININKAYQDEENPGILSLEFLEQITPLSNYYYYTVLIICILGSAMALWKREQGLIALIGLVILGTVLIFVFTEVQERYHYYALPLFALLAVYGLSEFTQAVGHRRQGK